MCENVCPKPRIHGRSALLLHLEHVHVGSAGICGLLAAQESVGFSALQRVLTGRAGTLPLQGVQVCYHKFQVTLLRRLAAARTREAYAVEGASASRAEGPPGDQFQKACVRR